MESLSRELNWLRGIIKLRVDERKQKTVKYSHLFTSSPPRIYGGDYYSDFVMGMKLSIEERLVFILALAPLVSPESLDYFLLNKSDGDRCNTEFGGLSISEFGGFAPTVQTALFLLAGNNEKDKLRAFSMVSENGRLVQDKLISLDQNEKSIYPNDRLLYVNEDLTYLILFGKERLPDYSPTFPADLLITDSEWEDLVVGKSTQDQLNHIIVWLRHQKEIMKKGGRSKIIKPGYRSLFYGPPGTGKTMSAALLGKATGRPVYRIDISMLVSKWIGETQKNLSRVFDRAAKKNWILFFDEADAIFSKRGAGSGGQEKYANQEVAYLLQRTENYSGMIILATNLKGNIDEAFLRRFQSVIYFQKPSVHEREILWTKAFEGDLPLSDDVDLFQIAEEFEISGGSIVNVVKYCAIEQLNRGKIKIEKNDVIKAIRLELNKSGKTI